MGNIGSIPCVSVLQNSRVKFKYNLCPALIRPPLYRSYLFLVLVLYPLGLKLVQFSASPFVHLSGHRSEISCGKTTHLSKRKLQTSGVDPRFYLGRGTLKNLEKLWPQGPWTHRSIAIKGLYGIIHASRPLQQFHTMKELEFY